MGGFKLYTFGGDGVRFGIAPSVIVVADRRSDHAKRKAREWAKENGIDPNSLTIEKVEEAKFPAIVFAYNGDG